MRIGLRNLLKEGDFIKAVLIKMDATLKPEVITKIVNDIRKELDSDKPCICVPAYATCQIVEIDKVIITG